MLANTLEYIQRLLFDFKYERDIREAFVFYYFHLIFEGYICLGLGFYCYNHGVDFYLFIKLLIITPFLFCVALSVCFMFNKNLKDPFSIFLVALTVYLTLIFPNIIGFYIGLIPVTILSTREDNSKITQVQKMEKEQLEHDIEIERQLLIERTMAKKAERLKKNESEE